MEHRCEERFPVHAAVDVWQRGQYLGRYSTRDLARGGVFIEAARGRPGVGQYVRLWLHTGDGHDLGGLVRYASDHGVGVMLAQELPLPHQQVPHVQVHAA